MSLFHRRRYQVGPAALAVAAAAALALSVAAPAAAAGHATGKAEAKPRVSFSFKHNRITSSTKPVITYTSAHLPSGAKLELQRTFGTAKVWKDVTALSGHSGTKTIPAVQLGRYSYRVKVYKKGKTVVLSAAKLLYSYGRVTLANLCNEENENIQVDDTDNCDPQTVQVGTHIFTYLIEDEPPGWTDTDTDVKVSGQASCRSISIQFALDNNADTSDVAYVQVIQSTADPQNASVAQGSIGNAYFTLSGSAWYLNLATSNAYNDNEYVNAYLSCWSASGLG
jgi:hypothetical protein